MCFQNKGICGETTEEINRRLYPDIIHDSQKCFGRYPDCVIIIGGTNDLGHDIPVDIIVRNIISSHEICRKEGIKSIGATIPPAGFEDDGDFHNRKSETNRQLRSFFRNENIFYADLFSAMRDNGEPGNLKSEYDAGDKLHFSVQGYEQMAKEIFEKGLMPILESQRRK